MNLEEVAGELSQRLASLFLPRREGPASVPRRRGSLRDRPALARPGAVPRILPWRRRPWPGGEPSDRVDRARGSFPREHGATPRRPGAGRARDRRRGARSGWPDLPDARHRDASPGLTSASAPADAQYPSAVRAPGLRRVAALRARLPAPGAPPSPRRILRPARHVGSTRDSESLALTRSRMPAGPAGRGGGSSSRAPRSFGYADVSTF